VVFVARPYAVDYLAFLYPRDDRLADFFQEWASARSFLQDGYSIYPPLREAAQRYLGHPVDLAGMHLGEQSTHPPGSVLLLLPLGALSYGTAFLVWNLVSLGILVLSLALVWRALKLPWDAPNGWAVAALILAC